MANTTILPFGEGQMPSGIGIVNDLKTGGSNKALSAEQGKVLGKALYDEVTEVYDNMGYKSTGAMAALSGYVASGKIPVAAGVSVVWKGGSSSPGNRGCLVEYNSSDVVVNYWSMNASERTITMGANTAYVKGTFLKSDATCGVKQNNVTLWSVGGIVENPGVIERLDIIEGELPTISALAETAVPTKLGKNLADPSKFINGRTISDVSPHSITSSGATYGGVAHKLTGYIPIKNGQTLKCNVSAVGAARKGCALFANIGDITPIADTYSTASGGTVITNNLGYDAFAVFCFYPPNVTDGVQVEIGSASTNYVDYSPIGGYVEKNTGINYGNFGDIGRFYPESVEDIVNVLDKNGAHCRFVHVSDNHQDGACQFAMTLADASSANFYINTGDVVTDKFSDSYSSSLTKMLAMTKPAYLTLGNHDCVGSASLQARYEKYIEPLNTHNGLTSNTKTYYSAVYNNVRCIFLDMCDAVEGSTLTMPYYLRYAKMTSDQINWFINELHTAKTTPQTVVCFIHVVPGYYDHLREDWSDEVYDVLEGNANGQESEGVHFLADIVDAFINGTTFSVTHNDDTYSGSFDEGTTRGMFAGWFAGHTHADCVGRVKDHPKQHFVIMTRPNNANTRESIIKTPTLDMANYVTIAHGAGTSRVCVYRVGSHITKAGGERKCFTYRF